MPDIFDTVGTQGQPTPAQQAQGTGSSHGDIFDQVAGGASTAANQPVQNTPPASDEIRINSDDSLLTKTGKAIGGTFEGIGEGVFGTAAGASDILDRTTGMNKGTVNRYLHTLAGDDNASHGGFQTTGQIGEAVGEFLLGDEALKSLSLSERLARTARVAKVLESHPLAAKAFQIGVNALRQGTVQGISSGVKDASLSSAGNQGVLGAGLTAGFGVAGETVNAIRNALDTTAMQKPLQDGIRSLLSDVADKAGVTKPTAPSIRDAAAQVAEGVKAKASGLYQTLDNLSGGQAQRYREAAKNVADKLSEIIGLDDEKEAELLKRQTEIEKAHQAMMDKLAKQGVDPDTLARADAAWKHQSALTDLSNAIRQSTNGLRPELANGVKGATTPETVNPKVLFTKVNRLADRGRLAQAIGSDDADNLLRHIDAAYVQAQKIAARQKFAAAVAKTVGISGAAAAGVHWAHELLGGQ